MYPARIHVQMSVNEKQLKLPTIKSELRFTVIETLPECTHILVKPRDPSGNNNQREQKQPWSMETIQSLILVTLLF